MVAVRARRLGAGGLLAAAVAFGQAAAAQAADDTPAAATDVPVVAAARAVQRTALATEPGLRFVLLQQAAAQAAAQSTTLAWQPATGAPLPVARLALAGPDPSAVVIVRLLRLPGSGVEAAMPVGAPAGLALATLEQLYTLVMRQSAEARYCLQDLQAPQTATQAAEGSCDGHLLGHAEALRDIAERRLRLVASAPAAARPWQVVVLQSAAPVNWDADAVAVQAVGPLGPLAGLPVYFHRAPHSLCEARTGADGVARCQLVDPHGEGHQHDHAAAVVASYPGDVAAQKVHLPTTHVLRPLADPTAPAFAARWALPVALPAP